MGMEMRHGTWGCGYCSVQKGRVKGGTHLRGRRASYLGGQGPGPVEASPAAARREVTSPSFPPSRLMGVRHAIGQ